MIEKYTPSRIVVAGALGCAVLAGCGTESASDAPTTPPSVTHSTEATTAPEVSPSALPIDILSGKGGALVCRGVAVLRVPEGFRTVANPILDPTTKQVLFTENASSVGLTIDTERDSAQPAAWYNLKGEPHNLADLPCKDQVLYTHEITQPSGRDTTVVTTSPHEFSGVTRLDLDALQGQAGLVDHDFGIESDVAMTQRLEQLAQQ